ncbi:hypothetical protein MMPV_008755 [Pyropia vietnamensis]
MEDAKANWRAAAAEANDRVAVKDAGAIARAKLRAVYDGFVDAPETLTLAAIKEQLLPTHIRDVGCLQLAHRMLLFADRLGVFAGESAEETGQRRVDLFESVYLPVLKRLGEGDRGLVATIVSNAAEKGLVDQLHVSVMDAVLVLEEKFSIQLQVVLMRLDRLEEAFTSGGEILRRAVVELRRLQGYLRDKEERDRKVALAKSAVKIGVSLAPIVGGALNAGVDAVAAFVEGAGAAVVCQYLADPTDIAAARQILECVSGVKSTLTNAQLQPLLVAMSPYASLEELDADLASAEACLRVDASAKEADVLYGAADAVGDVEAEVRAPDEVNDQLDKFKDVTTDAIVEHVVDKVTPTKRSAAEPRRDERARLPLAAPAGMPGGGGGSADTPALAPIGRALTCHPLPSMLVDAAAPAAPGGTALPAHVPSGAAEDVGAGGAVPPGPGPVAPASGELVGAMQEPAGTGTRQFGADFFAGVAGWSSAVLTSKLVEYASFASPERDEFAGVVRANAKQQLINGACMVRCEQADEVVAGLLGDWRQRTGPRLTVQCFVRDAKKHAPCL